MILKIRHSTIAMNIKSILKEIIVDERIKPGERINIDQLAKEFGVSKIPLREALKALEAEEIVVYQEWLGWRVASPSFERFKETLEMQYVLERHVAENMVAGIDYGNPKVEKVLREMHKVNQKFFLFSRASKYNKAMNQNHLFHSLYYSLFPNRLISHHLRILWNRDLQCRREITLAEEYREDFYNEHVKMINAIRGKETGKLVEAITSHFGKSIDIAGTICRKYFERIRKEAGQEQDRPEDIP
mgnify:FL=1